MFGKRKNKFGLPELPRPATPERGEGQAAVVSQSEQYKISRISATLGGVTGTLNVSNKGPVPHGYQFEVEGIHVHCQVSPTGTPCQDYIYMEFALLCNNEVAYLQGFRFVPTTREHFFCVNFIKPLDIIILPGSIVCHTSQAYWGGGAALPNVGYGTLAYGFLKSSDIPPIETINFTTSSARDAILAAEL